MPAFVIPATAIDPSSDFKLVVAMALSLIERDKVDREWGAFPITLLLEQRGAELLGDWRTWPCERQAVALVQMICKEKGALSGEIDGLWGHITTDAFEDLVHFREHEKLPDNWRDKEPNNASSTSEANPRGWPKESHASLTAFYGSHGNSSDHVRVRCPWPLRLSWKPFQQISSIGCHKKVADSLATVLEPVHSHYGEAELKRLNLDLFGGCYDNRKMRGGDSWSTHAWAIALDWDPDRNALKWSKTRASLARPEYDKWWEIWKKEGWYSLGRRKDYDWMHVQAAWR